MNILLLAIIIAVSLITIFILCFKSIEWGMDQWEKHVLECMQLYRDTRSDKLTDECFNENLIKR